MKTRSKIWLASSVVLILSMLLAACGTQPTPQVVIQTQVVRETEVVQQTQVVRETQIVEVVPTPVPSSRTGAWLDEVVFSVVSADSAVTQLNAATLDIYASGLSSADLPTIQNAGLNYSTQNGLYYELTFNPVGPEFPGTGALNPFASAKVREAMNWLVDRNYLNQEVYAGGGLLKFFPITTQFPDYAELADIARSLEARYAYDLDRADEVITEEMNAMGAEKVGGRWQFNGQPVTLIILIRTDSDRTRVPIGDYVGNQLESIGFTVDRQYKTSSEASPLWVSGNPADGLWHIYTGAWSATVIDRDQGDNFQFFYLPSSVYGFSPLWQAYTPSEEFNTLGEDLAYNRFNNLEERREAFARALELALEDSVRIWLIDGKNFAPFNQNVETAFDLAAGIDGSQIWPYTLRFVDREGGRMNWGQPDLFVDPWNAVAGSNWAFDASAQRATQSGGVMADPYTGLFHPLRLERAEVVVEEGQPVGKTLDWLDLEFVDSIEVPGDAWVDWDAENQVFITADEKFDEPQTAKLMSTVYYPSDLYDTVKWHDGSNMSAADFIMRMIMVFDAAKPESAIYDESQVSNFEAFMSVFKGFRVVSEDPFTLEVYTDQLQLDAEWVVGNGGTLWPNYTYGEAGWHQIAIGNLADGAGELAYSADKADQQEIEWMSFIGGPSLEILQKHLDQATEDTFIPYEPTLGQYITAEEAQSRYENLSSFYNTQGHFWLGTGPFYLGRVFLTEKTLTLYRFQDYPDPANRWSNFGEPKLADVEIDGPGQVTIGQEATFDIYVDFEGEPYPQDEVKEVKALLFDATGEIVFVGVADAVADGQYSVTIPANISQQLQAGANKLEVAVVPLVVAVPTFTSMEFVTAP